MGAAVQQRLGLLVLDGRLQAEGGVLVDDPLKDAPPHKVLLEVALEEVQLGVHEGRQRAERRLEVLDDGRLEGDHRLGERVRLAVVQRGRTGTSVCS